MDPSRQAHPLELRISKAVDLSWEFEIVTASLASFDEKAVDSLCPGNGPVACGVSWIRCMLCFCKVESLDLGSDAILERVGQLVRTSNSYHGSSCLGE